jgi:hypothetical protein
MSVTLQQIDEAYNQTKWLESPEHCDSPADYFSARLSFGSVMFDVYPMIREQLVAIGALPPAPDDTPRCDTESAMLTSDGSCTVCGKVAE